MELHRIEPGPGDEKRQDPAATVAAPSACCTCVPGVLPRLLKQALSQVYGFAREAGGHAAIYSEPGVGTTVRLYLPARDPEPAGEPVQETASVPNELQRGEGTVLVVEDDDAVLTIATETLADAGYRVLSAHNAFQVLEIIRSGEPIDVMFSDVVMPGGMNGLQLGAEVRRMRPDIKIMITTGYTRDALATQQGFADPISLLPKPYPPR